MAGVGAGLWLHPVAGRGSGDLTYKGPASRKNPVPLRMTYERCQTLWMGITCDHPRQQGMYKFENSGMIMIELIKHGGIPRARKGRGDQMRQQHLPVSTSCSIVSRSIL